MCEQFPKTIAGRLMLIEDMYAPMDGDGVRHPGHGVLTLGEFAALCNLYAEPDSGKDVATGARQGGNVHGEEEER